jgi:hypothetical protein
MEATVAYLNYLGSVPAEQVAALRAAAASAAELASLPRLRPSLLVGVSHLVGHWIYDRSLGDLLIQVLDGGTALHGTLWHPLRAPCYHEPPDVKSRHTTLAAAWQQTLATQPVPEDDWYRVEIEKVLRILQHAAAHDECVVSALAPPFDRERADKVNIPFELGDGGD